MRCMYAARTRNSRPANAGTQRSAGDNRNPFRCDHLAAHRACTEALRTAFDCGMLGGGGGNGDDPDSAGQADHWPGMPAANAWSAEPPPHMPSCYLAASLEATLRPGPAAACAATPGPDSKLLDEDPASHGRNPAGCDSWALGSGRQAVLAATRLDGASGCAVLSNRCSSDADCGWLRAHTCVAGRCTRRCVAGVASMLNASAARDDAGRVARWCHPCHERCIDDYCQTIHPAATLGGGPVTNASPNGAATTPTPAKALLHAVLQVGKCTRVRTDPTGQSMYLRLDAVNNSLAVVTEFADPVLVAPVTAHTQFEPEPTRVAETAAAAGLGSGTACTVALATWYTQVRRNDVIWRLLFTGAQCNCAAPRRHSTWRDSRGATLHIDEQSDQAALAVCQQACAADEHCTGFYLRKRNSLSSAAAPDAGWPGAQDWRNYVCKVLPNVDGSFVPESPTPAKSWSFVFDRALARRHENASSPAQPRWAAPRAAAVTAPPPSECLEVTASVSSAVAAAAHRFGLVGASEGGAALFPPRYGSSVRLGADRADLIWWPTARCGATNQSGGPIRVCAPPAGGAPDGAPSAQQQEHPLSSPPAVAVRMVEEWFAHSKNSDDTPPEIRAVIKLPAQVLIDARRRFASKLLGVPLVAIVSVKLLAPKSLDTQEMNSFASHFSDSDLWALSLEVWGTADQLGVYRSRATYAALGERGEGRLCAALSTDVGFSGCWPRSSLRRMLQVPIPPKTTKTTARPTPMTSGGSNPRGGLLTTNPRASFANTGDDDWGGNADAGHPNRSPTQHTTAPWHWLGTAAHPLDPTPRPRDTNTWHTMTILAVLTAAGVAFAVAGYLVWERRREVYGATCRCVPVAVYEAGLGVIDELWQFGRTGRPPPMSREQAFPSARYERFNRERTVRMALEPPAVLVANGADTPL